MRGGTERYLSFTTELIRIILFAAGGGTSVFDLHFQMEPADRLEWTSEEENVVAGDSCYKRKIKGTNESAGNYTRTNDS